MGSKTKQSTIQAIAFDDGTIWNVGDDCDNIANNFIGRSTLLPIYFKWHGGALISRRVADTVNQIKYSTGEILKVSESV